jgi:hypothetical protein
MPAVGEITSVADAPLLTMEMAIVTSGTLKFFMGHLPFINGNN